MTWERFRLGVFWALALWMLLSPALGQVFRVRIGWVRGWQMYSNSGVGTCDVRYFTRTEDGDTPLDRLGTLHPNLPWYEVPTSARRVELAEVHKIGLQLCSAVRAEDVRASVRCGSSKGWRNEMKRDENLCKRPGRTRP